jgi:hypothetical protein
MLGLDKEDIMRPGKYDITLTRGVTLDIPISYTGPDGTPIDLSNTSIKMQVRESPNANLIIEFNSDLNSNGFIFTDDAVNGNIRIFLTSANSIALRGVQARYDMQVRDSEDYVTHLLTGKFTISEDTVL